MKIGDLRPAVSLRERFHLSCRLLVPTDAGCYVLTSFDGEVLYVGLAKCLATRFEQHCNDGDKRRVVSGFKAAWFYYLRCSETELARLERGWMSEYLDVHGALPPLN